MGCILVTISAAGVLINSYFALGHVPQSIYNAEYALVFVYAFLFTHVRFLYPLFFRSFHFEYVVLFHNTPCWVLIE